MTGLDRQQLERLDWILVKADSAELTEWEEGFIAGMVKRRERYGDSITVTEKQWAVLDRIHDKSPL